MWQFHSHSAKRRALLAVFNSFIKNSDGNYYSEAEFKEHLVNSFDVRRNEQTLHILCTAAYYFPHFSGLKL